MFEYLVRWAAEPEAVWTARNYGGGAPVHAQGLGDLGGPVGGQNAGGLGAVYRATAPQGDHAVRVVTLDVESDPVEVLARAVGPGAQGLPVGDVVLVEEA